MNEIVKWLGWVCFLIVALPSYSQKPPEDFSRAMLHSTVRIETDLETGTGFIYFFPASLGTTNGYYPTIVTCWHVVSNASSGRFFVTIVDANASPNKTYPVAIPFPNGEKNWLRHPDPNIDLAVLILGPFLNAMQAANVNINLTPFSSKVLASDQDLKELGVFQEIKFIGYPIGIWDAKNNLPIARRGMLATDPMVDYNGSPKFLIDAAVFPGSSGSPVFTATEAGEMVRGRMYAGPRLRLLGIISEYAFQSARGNVEIVPIPSSFNTNISTRIPANLGVVIKAGQLNAFQPLLNNINKITSGK